MFSFCICNDIIYVINNSVKEVKYYMIDKTKIINELNVLAKQGVDLWLSVYKLDEKGLRFLESLKVDISKLPSFEIDYENWYTKCYRLIANVAPHRLNDFVSLYKTAHKGKFTLENYSISDALLGYTLSQGEKVIAEQTSIARKVKMQSDIVRSLEPLINDYFYNLELELEANIFKSELDSANELLKKKFLRPSGVVAGVVLEKHLKNICDKHGINITKKEPGISDFNDKLKEEKVIDTPTWRKIQLMGDLRNLCAHNKGVDPTQQQVKELLDGTKNIISTVF